MLFGRQPKSLGVHELSNYLRNQSIPPSSSAKENLAVLIATCREGWTRQIPRNTFPLAPHPSTSCLPGCCYQNVKSLYSQKCESKAANCVCDFVVILQASRSLMVSAQERQPAGLHSEKSLTNDFKSCSVSKCFRMQKNHSLILDMAT